MFARSVFQSVLERLQALDAAAEPADLPSARIAGLGAGFAAETQGTAAGLAVEQAYADMAGPAAPPSPPDPDPAIVPAEPEGPVADAPPAPPSFLSRLTPEEVLADLGIKPGDNPSRLAEQRRAFAALNHPDRHDPLLRAAATRRMMLANMLVDEALRRWRRAEARAAPRAPSRPRPQGQH